jgi:DNA-binding IclR family transcriptional regulator
MKVKRKDRGEISNSAERIINIFEYIISKDKSEVTIEEIANAFNISKSCSYRMLNILFKKGYLDHGKGESKYYMGFKIIEIGWSAISKNPLAKIASPYLEKLVNLTGESTILGILHNNEVFYIEKLGGKGILKVDVEVETRAPINCTSLGKVLVAWLPDHEISNILKSAHFKQYTCSTLSDKKLFLDELKKTRKRGYAITDEEFILGTCSIAVPIRNKDNDVIASLSLVIPKPRFTDDRIDTLIKSLFSISRDLAGKLSHFSKNYINGGAV